MRILAPGPFPDGDDGHGIRHGDRRRNDASSWTDFMLISPLPTYRTMYRAISEIASRLVRLRSESPSSTASRGREACGSMSSSLRY